MVRGAHKDRGNMLFRNVSTHLNILSLQISWEYCNLIFRLPHYQAFTYLRLFKAIFISAVGIVTGLQSEGPGVQFPTQTKHLYLEAPSLQFDSTKSLSPALQWPRSEADH